MKTYYSYITSILLSATIMTSSCSKEKGEHNEEEVITGVVLKFTPVGGGTTTEFSWSDPDGPGGNAPIVSRILLAPNETYDVVVEFQNDVEDINAEIEEEADAHRVYYNVSNGGTIQISNLDEDPNGVPLGLTSTWTTGTAKDNQQVTITLRHYPNGGKEIPDPVNSPKSATDLEVVFDADVR